MLGPVFLTAGYHKITHMSGILNTMHQHGVSGQFFWPVIALEILGALSLMCGFLTRFLAICFAIFCVLTGIIFHIDGASGVPAVVGGLKDFALSGGFVVLAVAGAGLYSVDALIRQQL
jgi:putative oxidoreductase